MIRRYYKSVISLKAALRQTINALLVFRFAYLTFHTGTKTYWYLGVITGITLIIQIILTEIKKASTTRSLHQVKHADQYYDEGAMLGKSFFLEDRILLCTDKIQVKEYPSTGWTQMHIKSGKKETMQVTLQGSENITFTVDNKLQAERLAAFLKKRNKEITIDGIAPKGNGTLQELKSE